LTLQAGLPSALATPKSPHIQTDSLLPVSPPPLSTKIPQCDEGCAKGGIEWSACGCPIVSNAIQPPLGKSAAAAEGSPRLLPTPDRADQKGGLPAQ